MQSLSRIIGVWLLVIAASAAGLRALDHVPGLLAGASRQVRLYPSLDEAERAVGERIWLPGYYPEDLLWPPARVEASIGKPQTVVVRIAAREDRRERLVVAQSLGAAVAPPAALLPAGQPIESTQVAVGNRPARLARVLLGPREVHDLSWDQDGRRVTLRYSGPVQQLLRMGASIERIHQ